MSEDLICTTITLAGKKIDLVAKTPEKLICYYVVPRVSDSIVIFPKAADAITDIAGQLGDAGKSIQAQTSLNSITEKILAVIPALAQLKASGHVAFTRMLEIHPIDRISFIIAVGVTQEQNMLGNISIDGIGFQIQVTKIIV